MWPGSGRWANRPASIHITNQGRQPAKALAALVFLVASPPASICLLLTVASLNPL